MIRKISTFIFVFSFLALTAQVVENADTNDNVDIPDTVEQKGTIEDITDHQPKLDEEIENKEWYGDIFSWIKDSPTNSISFLLNVVMFFLTIFGLNLYYRQKREYRLLQGIMQQFGIEEKIKSQKEKAETEYKRLHKNSKEIKQQIEEAENDLKTRLPYEAKKAYYTHSIPVIERQIFDLNEQLKGMRGALTELGEQPSTTSDIIKNIISDEVRVQLQLKKELEHHQIVLAILTGSAAAIGIILPYPLNLLAFPIAVAVISYCLKMIRLYGKLKTRPTSDKSKMFRLIQKIADWKKE